MVQCSQSPVRRHRGVCRAHAQPHKRRLWGYYTLTPRSGPNKTACAAVLHGSMFSKPCAPAQGRVPCTRAAAQAAALRLLYHDAAKRPQQNRTCCGFAWFNVLKALCVSTGACAMRTRSRASGGFEVIIPYFHSPAQRWKSAAPGAPHAPNTGHARPPREKGEHL